MNNRYNPVSKTKKQNRVIIIALIAVALVAAAFLLLRGCEDMATEKPKETPVYLEDEGSAIKGEAQSKTRDDILDELEKQQLVVTDKLSSNITFPSGSSGTIGDWIVENTAINNIILQAEVYLDDVLIAKSTPIYPNQHITGVELLTDIESGEYKAIAYLNYYNIETKEFVSKAGYAIHLTIK